MKSFVARTGVIYNIKTSGGPSQWLVGANGEFLVISGQ
jgi:hypothetical protein